LPVPLIGEASDTDRLIGRLTAAQQDAIRASFIWSGTVADRARALGVCADTMRDRVRAACFRLDDLYQAKRRPRAVPQTA
jgi:hypothetical protein